MDQKKISNGYDISPGKLKMLWGIFTWHRIGLMTLEETAKYLWIVGIALIIAILINPMLTG
jgi:hypothetical protein